MAYEKDCFMPSKHLRVCAKHFTKDSFELFFKLCQLVLKKDTVPTIFNFPMESCKPAIGQKTNKNKRVMHAGQLLGHFPSKIRFVFRYKPFPMNNALTQKRSSVQDNSDVTKQSLSSIPSIKCAVILETFL